MMNAKSEVILNVNDHEATLYATSRVLRKEGFTVLEAKTGEEAWEIVQRELPPLVVLDVNMPGISGVEVCRRIKQDPRTSSTMVLQTSATNVTLSDRVGALTAGADSFLIEPVEQEELVAVVRALLRLHRSEAKLRAMLAERNVLLREINHRIKNSLQLVTSILNLQSQEFTGQARERFQHAVSRVMAIASVHERLYQDEDPMTVAMDDYISSLCVGLSNASILDPGRTTISVQVEPVRLPTEMAVPVALIVNELVTNSLKYAQSPDNHNAIKVSLIRLASGELRLTTSDNGRGFQGPTAAEQTGLGRRLVDTFVRQLSGRIRTEASAAGYDVEIVFPEQAASAWRHES